MALLSVLTLRWFHSSVQLENASEEAEDIFGRTGVSR